MNKENIRVIAVDMGGTTLKCAVVDASCSIISSSQRPSTADRSPEEIMSNLEGAICDIMDQAWLKKESVSGIGIGLPGIVNTETGILHSAANFPQVKDFPLKKRIEERFHLPVFLGHDVDMAVLAEAHYGAGRNKQHIVLITIGTGIGMGMILNGKLYHGSHNGAGNFGHMVLEYNGSSSGIMTSGILEKAVSGPAIRAQAIASVRKGNSSLLDDYCGGDWEKIDARMVFRAAAEGDELSLIVVKEAVNKLGIGVANVINLLSPEVVIIGGGVSLAGELLIQELVEAVRKNVYCFPDIESRIVLSESGADSVIIGTAHTVLKSIT